MIKFLSDHLFAGIMEDFIMIDEMIYFPFDSLAEFSVTFIIFTTICLMIGQLFAEFLGFLLRGLSDYIQARKGSSHG